MPATQANSSRQWEVSLTPFLRQVGTTGRENLRFIRRPKKIDEKDSGNMTYARGRLWLGICGVGSAVSLCAIGSDSQDSYSVATNEPRLGLVDIASLAGLAGVYLVFMAPFDFTGGHVLPKRFGKSDLPLKSLLLELASWGELAVHSLFGYHSRTISLWAKLWSTQVA